MYTETLKDACPRGLDAQTEKWKEGAGKGQQVIVKTAQLLQCHLLKCRLPATSLSISCNCWQENGSVLKSRGTALMGREKRGICSLSQGTNARTPIGQGEGQIEPFERPPHLHFALLKIFAFFFSLLLFVCLQDRLDS